MTINTKMQVNFKIETQIWKQEMSQFSGFKSEN